MTYDSKTKDNTLRNALVAAGLAAVGATILAVIGWRFLEFDRALFVYAQALILSLALTVYRLTIWLHRPPTLVIYRRAFSMLKNPRSILALGKHLLVRVTSYFALNQFVWKRGLNRWGAHWPIMIGCVMALGIVVPLVFGWVWFETPADDLHSYEVMAFGIHLRTIPVDGIEAFLAFHGLVWASFPVLIGCSVALNRRWKDRGDQATQTFGHDIMPLVCLLSIAVTGLMMTISYSFLGGRLHTPLATLHCIIVCGTLLWLPFSKLFHIPQRSLKLAHMVYEYESQPADENAGVSADQDGKACCSRCGEAFADQQHVEDLIEVQKRLGYRYEMSDQHYQLVCPRCRRATLVIAQGKRWKGATA